MLLNKYMKEEFIFFVFYVWYCLLAYLGFVSQDNVIQFIITGNGELHKVSDVNITLAALIVEFARNDGVTIYYKKNGCDQVLGLRIEKPVSVELVSRYEDVVFNNITPSQINRIERFGLSDNFEVSLTSYINRDLILCYDG